MRTIHFMEDDDPYRPDVIGYTGEKYNEDDEILKTADFIKEHCQPWLEATNKGMFKTYRGLSMNATPGKYGINYISFKKQVRTDRKPKSSPQKQHIIMEKIIEMYGLEANRSNSIFVSGDDDQARGYGTVLNVIPIGEFNYTWSPQMRDWYVAGGINQIIINPSFYKIDLDSISDRIKRRSVEMLKTYLQEYLDKFIKDNEELEALKKTAAATYSKDIIKGKKEEWDFKANRNTRYIKALKMTLNALNKEGISLILDYQTILRKISKKHDMGIDLFDRLFRYSINVLFEKNINLELNKEMVQKELDQEGVEVLGDDGTLKKAINSEKEIMIKCERVVYIRPKVYYNVIAAVYR